MSDESERKPLFEYRFTLPQGRIQPILYFASGYRTPVDQEMVLLAQIDEAVKGKDHYPLAELILQGIAGRR
jgi:hypothetical protein